MTMSTMGPCIVGEVRTALPNKTLLSGNFSLRSKIVAQHSTAQHSTAQHSVERHWNQGWFEHMPIPDREKLRASLEATGEKEVRGKLAAGLYGAWKVKAIKEWLRDQEESRACVAAEEARARAKQNLSWTKIGVIVAVVAAVATWMAIWF